MWFIGNLFILILFIYHIQICFSLRQAIWKCQILEHVRHISLRLNCQKYMYSQPRLIRPNLVIHFRRSSSLSPGHSPLTANVKCSHKFIGKILRILGWIRQGDCAKILDNEQIQCMPFVPYVSRERFY